jgi:hypothetical protein
MCNRGCRAFDRNRGTFDRDRTDSNLPCHSASCPNERRQLRSKRVRSRSNRAQPLSLIVRLPRTLTRPMPPLVHLQSHVRSAADSARADASHVHANASSAITCANDAAAVAAYVAAIWASAVSAKC